MLCKFETGSLLTRGRLEALKIMERVKGTEPSLLAWELITRVRVSA